MNDLSIRSPAYKVGGIVYFGRMLDKIKANARGALPPEYVPNLGRKFDEHCVALLHLDYARLVDRVAQEGSDEEILNWCFAHGRRPADHESYIWNEFMRKRGWNDEISETLAMRKQEAGMAGRADIRTMFEFIDADEGRALPDAIAKGAFSTVIGEIRFDDKGDLADSPYKLYRFDGTKFVEAELE